MAASKRRARRAPTLEQRLARVEHHLGSEVKRTLARAQADLAKAERRLARELGAAVAKAERKAAAEERKLAREARQAADKVEYIAQKGTWSSVDRLGPAKRKRGSGRRGKVS